MIKITFSRYFILLLISTITISNSALQAQTLKLNPKTFVMSIFGTSTLHDFQSKVTQATGELVVNDAKQVQSFSIEIPVKSIKSNEKLMDTKTWDTFHADKFPTISFKSTEVNNLQVAGSDVNVTVTGNMTMAGCTKKVTLKSVGKMVKPGVYQFKGSIALKITDFKMTPPVMLIVKVGDAITLKYDLTLEGTPIN